MTKKFIQFWTFIYRFHIQIYSYILLSGLKQRKMDWKQLFNGLNAWKCYFVGVQIFPWWKSKHPVLSKPTHLSKSDHCSHLQIPMKNWTIKKTSYFQANNLDIIAPLYKGYGKDFMRKYKLHPDSYVQMALQMAYYRIYKK